jgi:hypothetical protein
VPMPVAELDERENALARLSSHDARRWLTREIRSPIGGRASPTNASSGWTNAKAREWIATLSDGNANTIGPSG